MTTETWTVTGPQTIDLPADAGDSLHAPLARLEVGLVRGRVDVVTHDEPGIRVEVHAVDGRPLEVSLKNDGTVKVGYAFLGLEGFLDRFRSFRARDSADVHVAVPANVAVKVGVVQAEGLLSGVREGASVSTVSGSVVVDGTAGHLRLNSVSGEVTVRDHDGEVVANTVSGELTVTGALPSVSVSTVSADATVDSSVTPRQLKVSSVSGDVLARVPAPDLLAQTVHTVSGRVLVDGVEHTARRGAQSSVVVPATGKDAGQISVNTVSGSVTVLRGLPTADERITDGADL
ncbi:putative adhesin [Sediminihabitans luteus]|uniref:Putative adhesin n=1 Tax=Sediminihabitans luteus TaxID=1138585 RepID=A0A2M9CDT8_9CELL|nr:DUF4097 family beta strand repeat-containing protein [Sediminihabitans luteus]PJJ70038.1 putative adhesin [Sediminihabitans luteus]GIJ00178.1 hypothetical protein Slu03_25550 [Sediminihabitans luteus]